MTCRVEMEMSDQVGGDVMDILVNERQEAETGQKHENSLRPLKQGNYIETSRAPGKCSNVVISHRLVFFSIDSNSLQTETPG